MSKVIFSSLVCSVINRVIADDNILLMSLSPRFRFLDLSGKFRRTLIGPFTFLIRLFPLLRFVNGQGRLMDREWLLLSRVPIRLPVFPVCLFRCATFRRGSIHVTFKSSNVLRFSLLIHDTNCPIRVLLRSFRRTTRPKFLSFRFGIKCRCSRRLKPFRLSVLFLTNRVLWPRAKFRLVGLCCYFLKLMLSSSIFYSFR